MRVYKEDVFDFDSRTNPLMFKKCSVCDKKAESDRYFHSHYGAVCCNGCRLFFHRVQIQVLEGVQLKCKSGGCCNTTPSKGKRWCLKCRFSKCLKVGMDPKKKTNHKLERKILIKNMKLETKRTNSGSVETSSVSSDDFVRISSSSSHDSESDFFGKSICEKTPELFEESGNYFIEKRTTEIGSCDFSRDQNFQLESISENYEDFPMDVLSWQSEIIEIMDSFTVATSLWKFEARHIINYHKDRGFLSKALFVSHLTNILQSVSQFASCRKQFASLKIEDQRTLLRKNLPLFMQYIIANYFGQMTGKDQLNWILMGQISEGTTSGGFRHRTFSEINNECQLFESSVPYSEYEHVIDQIQIHFPFSHNKIAFIANSFLFHTTNCTHLSDPGLVQRMFFEAESLLKAGAKSYGILNNFEELVHLLERMDDIFGDSLVSPDSSLSNSSISLDGSFANAAEETWWLEQQLNKLELDYQAIPLPENFLQEYLQLSSGIRNPNENFTDNWLKLSKDRVQCLLHSNLSISKLPVHAKTKMWSKNHMAVVALSLAYINTKVSGKEQLKNILGYMGTDTSWEGTFTNVLDFGSLQPVKFNDLNCGVLDDENINFFDQLVLDLSSLIGDEKLFHIMSLLVLLNPEGTELDSLSLDTLLEIRQSCLGQFQRKLSSTQNLTLEYTSFQKVVVKLRVFGKLLELFFVRDY